MALAAVFAMAAGGVSGAQPTDPVVGTWTLDVARSTYKPGPAPKSATVVIDAVGKAIKVAVNAVMSDGVAMKWGYTSARDGKDVLVTGNPNYDTANVTQLTQTEGRIVYKKAGKTIVTSETSVAKDGKTMTVTTTGTDPKGQAINIVAVYTKQ
jgi:hypothetical protein